MATKDYGLVVCALLVTCSSAWALQVTDTTDTSTPNTLVARDLNADFAAHNVTFNQATVSTGIFSNLTVNNITITGTETLLGDFNAVNITASGVLKGASLNITTSGASITGPTSLTGNTTIVGSLTQLDSSKLVSFAGNVNATNGLNVTGAPLTVGIPGTFSVSNATGNLIGTGGADVSGAAINLNSNSNFGVNIGTGNNTATVSIATGGSASTVAIGSASKTLTLAGSLGMTGPSTFMGSLTQKSGNVSLNADLASGSSTVDISSGSSDGYVKIGNAATSSLNLTSAAIGITGPTTITGALTSANGVISLNNNTNANVNVATGSSNGNVTIATGPNASTISIGSAAKTLTLAGTTGITGPTTLTGTLTQGGGQVTFNSNVDATNGLDVTGADLTVGTNFAVTVGTGAVLSKQITAAANAGTVGLTVTGDGTQNIADFKSGAVTVSIDKNGVFNGGISTGADITTNNLTVNGNTVLGTNAANTIKFNGTANSNLNMGTNAITNIGTTASGFGASGSLTVNDALTVTANGANVTGLVQAKTGVTATGGAVNVNAGTAATSDFAVNIASGGSTQPVTIGSAANSLIVNSPANLNGIVTLPRNGSGAGDYTFGVTGTTSPSATSSLIRMGAALLGGNANGTYLGLNAPSGFTGDFMNLQVNGVSSVKVTQTSANTELMTLGTPGASTSSLIMANSGSLFNATISSAAQSQNSNLFIPDVGMANANIAITNLAGDLNVTGKLGVHGDATMDAKLHVVGDVTMDAKLTVTGQATTNGIDNSNKGVTNVGTIQQITSAEFGLGKITNVISITAPVTFNSSAVQMPFSTETPDIPVAGAAVGDDVVVTPPDTWATATGAGTGEGDGFFWRGYVSSPGNVRIRIVNNSGVSPANPNLNGPRTWRISLLRH